MQAEVFILGKIANVLCRQFVIHRKQEKQK